MTRLLVVDDEPTIRILLGEALRDAGYEVHTAVHGAEALAQLRARCFDGVVLDMHMPVMDGPAFLEAVQQDAQLADLPVLYLTARTTVATHGTHVGPWICLAKPFLPSDVLGAVETLLQAAA